MKAIFIVYNQAFNEEVLELLEDYGQRGFTRWVDISGRGSGEGIPHMGNHAWPEMNHAVLTFVEDDHTARKILIALHDKDLESPDLGLRAFAWDVTGQV